MINFLIVRHGNTVGNAEKKLNGWYNTPLSETGRKQAEAVCDYILANHKIDGIFSSDLVRAVDTVKKVSERTGLPVVTSKNLREMNCGEWENKPFSELHDWEKYLSSADGSRIPGGETPAEVYSRVSAELKRIATETEDGKTVLIATHGNALRIMLCFLGKIPLEKLCEVGYPSNASVTFATYENGTFSLDKVGFDDYLADLKTQFIAE